MENQFYKYHALGNDYIVIDPNKTAVNLSEKNVRLICDRHFGIGSDGILYGPFLNDSVMRLQIFNPDGGEAEKSGNGVRIFSRYLADTGYVVSKSTFSLSTLGGDVVVELLDDKASQIRVNMGKTTFWSPDIPVAGLEREVTNELLTVNGQALRMTCVSIGNPHCVVLCDKISPEIATELGAIIETMPCFPNRINVQFLKVLDRHNILIEIWERGAGYTLASGSSSCAAASAAYKLGLVDRDVKVHMPGGTLQIAIRSDGCALMTGSVNSVAKGEFADDLWQVIQQ